ncbi:MAG: hypothetical protein LPK25_11545 [Cyclobacteriaceae bacterium]|nr:hypothetical protein [Cyclobacteriaceae bacterium]MDX5467202.1 hypothetical protein [Cyclobacteriaceae bacterium]
MKKFLTFILSLGLGTAVFSSCSPEDKSDAENEIAGENLAVVLDSNAVAGALPFTIEFEEKVFSGKPALPRLQSYVSAVTQDGQLFIAGGRRQGLHTFNGAPGINFVKDSANNFLFILDPSSGDQWSFDVNQLSGDYSAPLQSTNLQSYLDESTRQMYVVGGYGWKADGSNMKTFGTVIRFHLEDMANAIKNGANAQTIQSLMSMGTDDRLAITGGELLMLDGSFYLVFGQRFDGQYRAFGGSDFTQEYSNEYRTFRLDPQNLRITAYGAVKNSGADQPFHRRDGNIFESVDPKTGAPILMALGGVFKPGIIGAYDYPIYISGPGSVDMDSTVHQRFSQYECPVIPIYFASETDTSVYHTLFGGISAYYYHQTPAQKAAFDTVTVEGRNDGFPFVSDVSTFQRSSKGTYQEYILPDPIIDNRLLGTSIPFIKNPQLSAKGMAFANGVLQLNNFPEGSKVLVGYIYGGIEAEFPLPLQPNHGTFVSNSLFAVYVTRTPSAAIPASFATKARNGAPLTQIPR